MYETGGKMNFNDIIKCFGIDGTIQISEIKDGHINHTFLVECPGGENYVLQSINRKVFHNPENIMENINRIEKVFEAHEEESVTIPHYICTENGQNYVEFEDEIYRMYNYTAPSENVNNKFYMSGFSFGTFIRRIGVRSIRLKPTIENFHSYSSYFSLLVSADKNSGLKKIDKIIMGRLDSLRDTLEQVFTVDFPKRNVHNDAKISNVIFGEKCTVIDLDTAMDGYAAIDYGDLIRSVCTSEQLDFKVICDVTNGFAAGLEGILTDDEIYSLYYGMLYVTGELAVRYLIDYLSEEKYFNGKSSAECLNRANELLRQLNLFISGGDELVSIIYKAFKKQ